MTIAPSMFLTALFLSASFQAPSSAPPPAILSPSFSKSTIVETTGDAIAMVTALLSQKKVTLSWSYTTFGPAPDREDAQEISVAYWPTEIMGLGGRRLAVAGKARATTIIEIWTFSDGPLPLPYINQSTGEWVYPKYNPTVVSKDLIYAEATVGRDIVCSLYPNPVPPAGVSASVYAQFYDSSEIYRVDDSGAYQKIASPSDASVLLEPNLLGFREVRWSGDHAQHGYVYCLARSPHSTSTFDPVVMVDSDRDGVIDACLSFDVTTWQAQSWDEVPTPFF